MITSLKNLVIFLLIGLLAGCGVWREYQPARAENLDGQKNQRQLTELLSRFHVLAGLSNGELARAYDGALLRLEAQQDIASGLEAAFVFALLKGPQKGAKEVKAFLKQFEKAGFARDREDFRGVAVLLKAVIQLQQENERLRIGIREEKEHAEKLAHQLKELKNIEKIIYERENLQFNSNEHEKVGIPDTSRR